MMSDENISYGVALGDEHPVKCFYCREIMSVCRVICVGCSQRYQWIPVKDQLPEHEQLVLAVPKDVASPAVLRFQAGSGSGNGYLFMWPDLKAQVRDISHWMPLPEPPHE